MFRSRMSPSGDQENKFEEDLKDDEDDFQIVTPPTTAIRVQSPTLQLTYQTPPASRLSLGLLLAGTMIN